MSEAGSISKVGKKLSVLDESGAHLFLSTASNRNHTISKVLADLISEKKQDGVYVSLNKECDLIRKKYIKPDMASSLIYYIETSTHPKDHSCVNCMHVSSPYALTELSLAVNTLLSSGKFRFLIFDSLDTLEIHHNPKIIEQFIHYLAVMLHKYNITGIILASDGKNKSKLLLSIMNICDDVTELS
ncbi:MAG: hypothetical protein AABY40_02885 [Nanoarchaeota archaeon]